MLLLKLFDRRLRFCGKRKLTLAVMFLNFHSPPKGLPILRQEVTLSTQDFSQIGLPPRDGTVATAIVDLLIAAIGRDRFEMWFSHPECIRVETNDVQSQVVIVEGDCDFSLRRIQQTFGGDLRTAIDRVCGPQAELVYLVAEAPATEAPAAPPTVQQSIPFSPVQTSENGQRSIRRAAPSLSSFCFSPESKMLKAGVAQLFESPGQYSPLFIYGPTGSGKSHLLEAITNDFRRKLRMKRCVYVSAEQFTTQFVSSLRQGTGLPVFRRKFRDLDLLAIDDVQFFAGKKATLAEFQQTLDNLTRMGKQVVLSADRSPMELGQLGSDICARLSAGLSCDILYPDLEGRFKIVKRMCATRGFELPNSVMRLVCEQLPRDVRRLSGAINRLHAYSVTFDETITPEFAHEVLSDLFSMTGPCCTSMVSIEQAVCDFCGVNPSELKSPSRQKRISAARMLAMYLSREYTGSAFSEIGDYFGGRSHSTVIAAQRKVTKWLENDEGISLPHAKYSAKEAIRRLESNLRIS